MSQPKEEELKIEGQQTSLKAKPNPPAKTKPFAKTGKCSAPSPAAGKTHATIGSKIGASPQKNTLLGQKPGKKAKNTFEEKKDPASSVLSAYETRIISNLISKKLSMHHMLTEEEKFRRMNLQRFLDQGIISYNYTSIETSIKSKHHELPAA